MRKYWGWEIHAIPWIHVDFLLSEHTKLSPWSGITRWPDLYVEGDRLACQGLDLDTPKILRFYTIRTDSESLRMDWRPDGIVHCFWMPRVSLSCGRISAWRCRCPASVVIQLCLQNAWAEFDPVHDFEEADVANHTIPPCASATIHFVGFDWKPNSFSAKHHTNAQMLSCTTS